MKTIEMIINETKTNEAMRQELAEAVKTNTVTEFLKNQGCEATVEEFVAAIKEQAEAMGEDELDATAGGMSGDISSDRLGNTLVSCITLGLACVVEIIKSVTGSGRGKKTFLCDD